MARLVKAISFLKVSGLPRQPPGSNYGYCERIAACDLVHHYLMLMQVTDGDVDLFFAPLKPLEELQLPSESVQAKL